MEIFVETYGCSANLNNAEIIKGILSKKHKLVDDISKAELVVLNTCVVKGPTENRMLRRIKDIEQSLIVTGCMSDLFVDRMKKIRSDVIVLGIKHIKDIEKAIGGEDVLGDKKEIKLSTKRINANPLIDIIQISEGCVGDCSYCLTKLVKGNLFSFPVEKIVNQVKRSKCKEIWLTSQDNGAYGLDIGTDLIHLLKEILKLKKKFKLRIGMINPNHAIRMFDGLVDVLKDKRVFKFLHLPVQSLNDSVLKHMNRFYTVKDFVSLVERLRKKIPQITISTDLIVGYPIETKSAFNETLRTVKKLALNPINISRYWPRKGTLAYDLDELNVSEVKERAKKLKTLSEQIFLKENKNWIGWTGKAFIDDSDKHGLIARNFAYRLISLDSGQLGSEVDVKIVAAGVYCLNGVLIF
jgi:threonylcarbamoyladenosine tRNA methylthiotransferase CDKAL1